MPRQTFNANTIALRKTLKLQMKTIEQGCQKLQVSIEKLYPNGTHVGVMLKHGQRIPSPARVIGVSMQVVGFRNWHIMPEVRVQLDNAKPNSRLSVREVGLENVVALKD